MKTITLLAVGLLLAANAAGQDARALLARCDAAHEKGNEAEAVKLCSQAIALAPRLTEAYMTRAFAYKALGRLDDAIGDQTRLIDLTSGMTMFLVYRAELYITQGKQELAFADLSRAVSGTRVEGLYGARAYYCRGTIYEGRGDKAAAISDYESALRLRPGYTEANTRLTALRPAPVRPAPAPTPLAVRVIATPKVTPAPGPAAVVPASATGWKRMELTGTGLSVESPVPFVLKQDKPDPLIEAESANVFWTMSHSGIFATVRYIRTTDKKTARSAAEFFAKLMAANGTPPAAVIDTMFAGQSGVDQSEEYTDVYDPNKTRKKRRMVVIGPPGELTSITINYPVADAAAAKMAEQIMASFVRQGSVIAETPKMPPANWQRVSFRGLSFDTPNPTPEPTCGLEVPDSTLLETARTCYNWDRNPIVAVVYKRHRSAALTPSPQQLAERYIAARKEVMKESTLKTLDQYAIEPFQIAGAEAVRVKMYTGYEAAGTREEKIFLRRGAEIWEVRTYEFIRWSYTTDAVKRITASLRF